MSRSNPTADPIINPCKRWFQWDSTTKMFKYYDKELPNPKDASKKGANVAVKLPFQFLVLDVLTTVAGFCEDQNSSYYANEVRNYMGSTKSEILSVKVKGKEVLNGTWESIKVKADAIDAKFANSIYIGYFDENKVLQLGNIKFFGAPIGAWIEATTVANKAGKKIEDCAFKVASTKEGKKGNVTWNEPVFTPIEVSEKTNAAAIELDKVLQEFLTSYLSTPVVNADVVGGTEPITSEHKVAEVAAPVTTTFEDDEPF